MLAHFLVYLGGFSRACLALLFGCYCLLCVFTVFNLVTVVNVCVYVELLLLSVYAFGFHFWPIFTYYFC